MKTIIIFLCTAIISSAAISQQVTHMAAMKEGVVMKNGKMWYIKALTGPMTLDNGVVVSTDGTLKDYRGKTTRLAQGKHVDFAGSFHKIDPNRGLIEMDHNTVWVWSVLDKPIHLSNGSYVMPDGTIKLTSGKYQALKDKEFVDFDGNMTTVSL
jgi:hypothetical protein